MRGRRSSLKIVLSEQDREELEHLVRSTSVRAGVARRARIVLELAAGARLVEIAEWTGVTEQVVRHWGRRYLKHRLEGLYDLPRTGRPPVFPPEVATHAVKIACQRPDTAGRSLSQWDCAEIVRQLIADGIVERISLERVRQLLADHRLKPWRVPPSARPLLVDEPGRAAVRHSAAQEVGNRGLRRQGDLAERLHAFIAEWNQVAHPFQRNSKSFNKVLAKCQRSAHTNSPAQIAA